MFPLLLVLGSAPGAGTDPVPVVEVNSPHCASAASTWGRMFPASGYCAGPALQPFQKQPRVCPVAVCPCEPFGTDDNWNRAWVKEFHAPAHVAYPRFDIDGRPVPGDGLVIYEGMRLTVDPITGKYDLTFTATVPGMPANLRLQLVFEEKLDLTKSVALGTEPRRYTLTLPPIRMQPPRDAEAGDPTPRTFHIAHRGYSSLFIDPPFWYRLASVTGLVACPVETPITCKWTVSRVGTARFGTPIAVDDPQR